MLGMKLPNFTLKSGQVYDSFDGKRLIYEVGCNSVIYMISNPKARDNYSFYIQPMDDFAFDVTTRSAAAKVTKMTAPIKTIVKYEMYFIMGIVSTISLPALIIVVGSDVAVSGIMMKAKFDAAKKFSNDLMSEHHAMSSYAPTLHTKLDDFFKSQAKVKLDIYPKKLPETIVKDEKTQAQLAGVLIGKYTLSPKAFTVWTAVFTILTTAVIKSVTKSPETYYQVLDQRYRPILDELLSVNWDNTIAVSNAASKFRKIMEDAGIEINDKEALAILIEINQNQNALSKSLVKIDKSFREFKLAMER